MIKLSKTVGYDYKVDTNDIFKIKAALHGLGYYKIPEYGITQYPDEQLFKAIKSFQKDNNLKIDGIIKPEGKTILALNKGLPADMPGVKGPFFCPECGGRYGGVYGDLCQWCIFK